MYKRIREMTDVKTNEIFEKFQGELGIKSGDIEPLMWARLDDAQEKLADIIKEALLFQCLTNGTESRKHIGELLTAAERDNIYYEVRQEKVKEDTLKRAEDTGVDITEDEAETVADRFVNDGEYESNLSYWDNLDNLIKEL